jgi:hypothetical protein
MSDDEINQVRSIEVFSKIDVESDSLTLDIWSISRVWICADIIDVLSAEKVHKEEGAG